MDATEKRIKELEKRLAETEEKLKSKTEECQKIYEELNLLRSQSREAEKETQALIESHERDVADLNEQIKSYEGIVKSASAMAQLSIQNNAQLCQHDIQQSDQKYKEQIDYLERKLEDAVQEASGQQLIKEGEKASEEKLKRDGPVSSPSSNEGESEGDAENMKGRDKRIRHLIDHTPKVYKNKQELMEVEERKREDKKRNSKNIEGITGRDSDVMEDEDGNVEKTGSHTDIKAAQRMADEEVKAKQKELEEEEEERRKNPQETDKKEEKEAGDKGEMSDKKKKGEEEKKGKKIEEKEEKTGGKGKKEKTGEEEEEGKKGEKEEIQVKETKKSPSGSPKNESKDENTLTKANVNGMQGQSTMDDIPGERGESGKYPAHEYPANLGSEEDIAKKGDHEALDQDETEESLARWSKKVQELEWQLDVVRQELLKKDLVIDQNNQNAAERMAQLESEISFLKGEATDEESTAQKVAETRTKGLSKRRENKTDSEEEEEQPEKGEQEEKKGKEDREEEKEEEGKGSRKRKECTDNKKPPTKNGKGQRKEADGNEKHRTSTRAPKKKTKR
ncbi:hypothetical protein PROFUN_15159 [Planoprotostelium fungivorum]|uniref:Uncharacterized protein n=1 Tax=Planoprotostelium fungivorum TaxID=1890364 RepID=A0A2P6MXQ5_9EUKA|nr:hypothetical protein PROFUN_15159 [Planoprotostelium fungivorum]